MLVQCHNQDTSSVIASSGPPQLISHHLVWIASLETADEGMVSSVYFIQALSTLHLLRMFPSQGFGADDELLAKARLILLGNAINQEDFWVVESAFAFLLKSGANQHTTEAGWDMFAAHTLSNHPKLFVDCENHPFLFLYIARFVRPLSAHPVVATQLAKSSIAALKVSCVIWRIAPPISLVSS